MLAKLISVLCNILFYYLECYLNSSKSSDRNLSIPYYIVLECTLSVERKTIASALYRAFVCLRFPAFPKARRLNHPRYINQIEACYAPHQFDYFRFGILKSQFCKTQKIFSSSTTKIVTTTVNCLDFDFVLELCHNTLCVTIRLSMMRSHRLRSSTIND